MNVLLPSLKLKANAHSLMLTAKGGGGREALHKNVQQHTEKTRMNFAPGDFLSFFFCDGTTVESSQAGLFQCDPELGNKWIKNINK